MFWVFAIVPVVALIFASINYKQVVAIDEGTAEMKHIAEAIRVGADAFVNYETRVISIYAIVIAIILTLVVEWYVGVAF